jgi:NAD(P)-dependent dehydrogenase (short-subunit alcohol dehydrogenase family)
VKQIGPKAVAVRADASSIADLAHLFDTVKAAKGRIDVLFANAGIYEFTPFGTITEDAYDKMFDINVKGRAVHGTAGRAADGRWRLDHSHRIGCGFERL